MGGVLIDSNVLGFVMCSVKEFKLVANAAWWGIICSMVVSEMVPLCRDLMHPKRISVPEKRHLWTSHTLKCIFKARILNIIVM